MKKNRINILQLVSMLIMLMVAAFNNIENFSLIKNAGIESYLSILMGGIVGFGFLLIFFKIASFREDLAINQKIIVLFGKKLGLVINIMICLLLVLMGGSIMYNLNNFVVSQFLSETPFLIIGICFSVMIIYINIKGIETLSRVTLILVVINSFLYLIAIISLVGGIEMDNFLPFLQDGIMRPIGGIKYVITMNIVPIFLLLMIPKNSIVNKEGYNKWMKMGYIYSFVLIFFAMISIIGNLGIYLASTYQYPEYIVLKKINILNFLDRIENFIVIQWFFGLFISLGVNVYYISKTIKNKPCKFVPIIITLIILVLSNMAFKNNTVYNIYSYKYIPYVKFAILGIFVLIFLRILTYKKKHLN